MHLTENNIYHVFNRGNNKQKIFFSAENYPYFLYKTEKYIKPVCDILAWCLMPNHFHFLIQANVNSVSVIEDKHFKRQQFSQGVKQLLSWYTKAINKHEKRTGSLFQQNTKSVCVTEGGHSVETAFHYIHQNPLKASLVTRMEDWAHSSFREYMDLSENILCNKNIMANYINLDIPVLYKQSYQAINFDLKDDSVSDKPQSLII